MSCLSGHHFAPTHRGPWSCRTSPSFFSGRSGGRGEDVCLFAKGRGGPLTWILDFFGVEKTIHEAFCSCQKVDETSFKRKIAKKTINETRW